METKNLQNLVEAWLRFTRSKRDSEVRDELLWAYEEFARLSEEEPDACLSLICAVLEEDATMPVIGALAAGPMEDLLVNFGPGVIDNVEAIAEENGSFRAMLGGVWESDIEPQVWERITQVRDYCW